MSVIRTKFFQWAAAGAVAAGALFAAASANAAVGWSVGVNVPGVLKSPRVARICSALCSST